MITPPNPWQSTLINELERQVVVLRELLQKAEKDAALWKARLHTYLMYRCHADSNARDEILKCELRTLMGENKPTFDEWVAAIDAAIDQAMKEEE